MIARLLLAAALCSAAGAGLPDDVAAPKKTKCTFTTFYKMLMADCYGMDLEGVPLRMRTSIEILELSHNRIRSVMASELDRYPNLKILYLGDNMIKHIAPTAFDSLQKLEVLDVAKNSFDTLPSSILQLPRLRKLYLGTNAMDTGQFFGNGTAITAPLEFLDLSAMALGRLPRLGVVPTLRHLNLSASLLEDLSPADFAGLCGLKTVETVNLTAEFRRECDCERVRSWLRAREVRAGLECDSSAGCEDARVAEEDERTFAECLQLVREREHQEATRQYLMYAGIAVGVLLAVAAALLYRWHARRRRRSQAKVRPGDRANSPTNTNLLMDEVKENRV